MSDTITTEAATQAVREATEESFKAGLAAGHRAAKGAVRFSDLGTIDAKTAFIREHGLDAYKRLINERGKS